MRCNKVQKQIEDLGEAGLAGAARRHFEVCGSCQTYAQDAVALRTGLRLLAQEAGPSPSWGFTARVLRNLGKISPRKFQASEFFESAGRRVVLATLLLVLTLFLAMILPATGPLRQSTQLDAYWPRGQTANGYYSAQMGDFPAVPAVMDVSVREAAFHR